MCKPNYKHTRLQARGLFAIMVLLPTAAFSAEAIDIGGGVATQLNTSTTANTTIGNTDSNTFLNGDTIYIQGAANYIGASQESINAIGTYSGSQNTIGSSSTTNRISGTNTITGSTSITGDEVRINTAIAPKNTTIGNVSNSGTISLMSGFSGSDYHAIDITPDQINIGGSAGTSTISIGSASNSEVFIGSRSGNSTVDFGGNRLQNVGNAVAGSDAVNLNQLNSAISGVNNAISGLQNQVNSNKAGIAGVTAATNLPGLNANQKYNFGVAWGNYMAYNGIALGGNARLAEKVTLKVSGSATSGVYSGGAGLAFGF